MKKLFYVLCMSALIFTGCKKSSSPIESVDNSSNNDLVGTFCDKHPTNELCEALVGKTELSLQEIKPVMKLEKNSTDMLYGASNPDAWHKGYFNLHRRDENGSDIIYTNNFSVEDGSIFMSGEEFSVYTLNLNAETTSIDTRGISAPVGGNNWSAHTSTSKWGPVNIHLAVFQNLGKYFYLPTLRFVD